MLQLTERNSNEIDAVCENQQIWLKHLIDVFKSVKQCEWKYVIRYIWIGFYKNDTYKKKNNKTKHCYFYLLPKDIIKHLIKFIINKRVHEMIKVWSNEIQKL